MLESIGLLWCEGLSFKLDKVYLRECFIFVRIFVNGFKDILVFFLDEDDKL